MTGFSTNKDSTSTEETTSSEAKKKPPAPTKLVLRRLPPIISEDELLEQLSPIPQYNYFLLAPADSSLNPWAYSRAYINLCNVDDILAFRDRFDGYVLVDAKDAEYKSFLEKLESPEQVQPQTIETTLEEIEKKTQERKDAEKQKTPLLEFLVWKKEEKIRIQKERRLKREEERRRREEERKRRLERERLERERRQKQKEEWARMEKEAAAAASKQKQKDTRDRDRRADDKDKDKGGKEYDGSGKGGEIIDQGRRGGGRIRKEQPPRFRKEGLKDDQHDNWRDRDRREFGSRFGAKRAGPEKGASADDKEEESGGFGRSRTGGFRKQDGSDKGGFSRVKQDEHGDIDVDDDESPSLPGPKTVAASMARKKQAESKEKNNREEQEQEREYWESTDKRSKNEKKETGIGKKQDKIGSEVNRGNIEKWESSDNKKERAVDAKRLKDTSGGKGTFENRESLEKRKNKDRPSVQLYQPGARRRMLQRKQEEEKNSSASGGDKKISEAQDEG